MDEKEYLLICETSVANFNTKTGELSVDGWCPNNNIVVDDTGNVYQEWCRFISYAPKTE